MRKMIFPCSLSICICIFLCLLLLSACSAKSDPENNTNSEQLKSLSASKIPEYRVIELYADLTATPTAFEGVWESACIADTHNSSYYQFRRVFHLDGVFREVASFNDVSCNIRNSQNTLRLFGTITSSESLQLFNGVDNIEVNIVSSDLKAAPLVGRPIPIASLTLGDLTSYKTTIEAFSIVTNRLYVTENFDPNSYALLGNGKNYLINDSIDTGDKTEAEIDQQAIDLFNPLNN